MNHARVIFCTLFLFFFGMAGCSEDISRDEPAKAVSGKTPVVQPEEIHGWKALDGSPLVPPPATLAGPIPAPDAGPGTPPQASAEKDQAPVPASGASSLSPPASQASTTSPPSAPSALSAPVQASRGASPLDAAKKLLVVVTPDWNASRAEVTLYARDSLSAPWKRIGSPSPCQAGRNGLAWGRGLTEPLTAGPRKKEGDGKTPAGLFPLPLAFGYEPPAKAAQAGIRLPYRELTASTVCVTDPDSAVFNDLADSKTSTATWTRQDRMIRDDNANRLGAVIGHNRPDPQPSLGSCVFLNLEPGPGKPTGGSIGCPEPLLREMLSWLEPDAKPLIAILPQPALAAAQSAWGLPR